MEFRKGSHERRHNRRICPSCQRLSGSKSECPQCGKKTAARIQINWYVNGKRNRELTACWRDQDAAAVLQRREADYWRQQQLGVEREVGGSLRQAVDAFVATQTEHSVNYRKQLRTAFNALAGGLGWDHPIQEITAEHIGHFKQQGLSALSRSTVRSYMLVLRRFFSYLHEEGWIRRNPTSKVKMPEAKGRKDHLRPEEVGRVLDAIWQESPEIAPIFTALILGGWRKGEIVNLRHADVDLEEGWAYVLDFEGDDQTEAWSPKTENSQRAVPLHPLVVRALERVERVRCPDGRLSPWVFPVVDTRKLERRSDRHGRPQPVYGDRRSPGTTFFGPKLQAALKAAGVERTVTIHGLRRTFAVLLQEAGAQDSVIRQALGHGERGVTEFNYLPRRDPLIKQWVDAIQVNVTALEPKSAPYMPPGGGQVADDCHQFATSPVANRPPYLRLVK